MTPEQAADLHSLYTGLTGLSVPLDLARQRAWHEWGRAGFTADDLRLVISYLRAGIRAKSEGRGAHQRNAGCLRFSNLIVQTDLFEEDLAAARLWRSTRLGSRPRPPHPSPEIAPPDPTAEEELRRQAIEGLRAFRKARASAPQPPCAPPAKILKPLSSPSDQPSLFSDWPSPDLPPQASSE